MGNCYRGFGPPSGGLCVYQIKMKMNMKISTVSVAGGFLILTIAIITLGFWRFSLADGSTITACVNKAGMAYLIGEGFAFKKCNGKDKLISWNIVGPQGLKGEKGDTGEQGPQGEKGENGQQGAGGSTLNLLDGGGQDLGMLVAAWNSNRFTTFLQLDNDYKAFIEFQAGSDCSVTPCRPVMDVPGATVYFTQPNCTGDAFISTPSNVHTITYEGFHRSSGYFLPQIETLSQDRLSLSQMGQSACLGDNTHRSNTVLVHYVSLPFTEPLAWPLKIQ